MSSQAALPSIDVAEPSLYSEVARLLTEVYVEEGFVPGRPPFQTADITSWAKGALILVAHVEAFTATVDLTHFELGRKRTVVEELGRRVLGVVGLALARDGRTQIATVGEAEIQRLAVDAPARGEGVGRILVEDCVRRSRAVGADRVVLWTRPSMIAAQRLYTRLGFQRQPHRDQTDPRGQRLVYSLDLRRSSRGS